MEEEISRTKGLLLPTIRSDEHLVFHSVHTAGAKFITAESSNDFIASKLLTLKSKGKAQHCQLQKLKRRR